MFVVSFKKLINEEINFSPRLRTVHFRGTGHPLNRDYQDFSFFETPPKHRPRTVSVSCVSKIQETSLGREMHAIVRTSTSIHSLSTVLHRASVKIGLRFPLLCAFTTSYPIFPSAIDDPSIFPSSSDVQTFPNPSPRLENCLFSNLFSSEFSI